MTIEAQRQAIAEPKMPKPTVVKPPELALLAQVEDAASFLTHIGTQLGNVGKDDETACAAFAEQLRANMRAYINQMLTRKRKELSDLERILGRQTGG